MPHRILSLWSDENAAKTSHKFLYWRNQTYLFNNLQKNKCSLISMIKGTWTHLQKYNHYCQSFCQQILFTCQHFCWDQFAAKKFYENLP